MYFISQPNQFTFLTQSQFMMKVLILFFIISLSAAQKDGKRCVDRPKISSIDVEKLSGKWYTVKTYPNYHEKTLNCLNHNLAKTGDLKYDWSFCEKFNGTLGCTVAKCEHPDGDGKMTFNVVGRKFFLNYLKAGKSI